MIKIRIFGWWNNNDNDFNQILIKRYENGWGLLKDEDYNVKYKLVADESFTHVILLNSPMPNLKNIPKKNVIGFSFEPLINLKNFNFLEFVKFAGQHISCYYIGNPKILPKPFTGGFCYQHSIPFLKEEPKKTKLMSIIFSKKKFYNGHKYRHLLVNMILKTNLPIDIYGRGCSLLRTNDNRIKGEFEDNTLPIKDYKFHIAIENTREPHYISEKLLNPLLTNTKPLYLGCLNVKKYFPGKTISLTGNIRLDMFVLKKVCDNPDKYYHDLNVKETEKFLSLKHPIKKHFLNG